MNKEELRDLLRQPYRLENWKQVVDEVFPNVSYLQNPLVIDISHKTDKVESFKQLGTVRLNDGKNLAMFEVHVAPNVNISRNRVELRNLVAPFIDQERSHGVLVIYEQGLDDYRFTFTAKETEFDEEQGDFYQKETDTKRYTYVLGPNESCRTPGDRFWELSQKKSEATLNDVEKAFSVERLSKEFFTKYKQHYEAFVDYLNGSKFKASVFNGDEKAIRDFVKIMLGRIVFLHFVQKKGWLGASSTSYDDGDKNFMLNFWKKSGKNEIFYTNHLSELFEALNTNDRPGDAFNIIENETVCIPYLGGGLFEEENGKKQWITFPESLFEGLFNFFGEYNFTIDENDPEENEVGIDPEMLGHIFENLLEDNKDKGAFYTPKAIVKYMCQESLIQYLITYFETEGLLHDTAIKEDVKSRIERFVRKYEGEAIIDYDRVISEALFNVKICDPAIGSGAFPMGILNEMMMMINTLHHASPDVVEELWEMKDWHPSTVKKHIIQNSIYGVDIEKGAIDIARLRFWLSLIIDEDEPCTLPSLDYKIVVGDSLVSKLNNEIIEIEWSLSEGVGKTKDIVESIISLTNELIIQQKRYFDSDANGKQKIKVDISKLKIDLLINQLYYNKESYKSRTPIKGGFAPSAPDVDFNDKRHKRISEFEELISKLNRYKLQNSTLFSHFDWKLDFPEIFNTKITNSPGFDIVIGNPPYLGERKNKNVFLDVQKSRNNKYYLGRMDYFYFFYHLGIDIIKNNSIVTLITTNYFPTALGARKLRTDIKERASIIKVINFNEGKVFDSAYGQHNMITILQKGKSQFKCESRIVKYKGFLDSVKLQRVFYSCADNELVTLTSNDQNSLWDGSENYLRISGISSLEGEISVNSILSKIGNESSALLGVICKPLIGLESSLDRVYVLTNSEMESVVETEQDKELFKPFFKNSDIDRYHIEDKSDNYIIYVHEKIDDIRKYVGVWNYLLSNEAEIKKRKGANLRGAYRRGNWWVLNTPRLDMDFKSEKIVTPYRTKTLRFALSDDEWYASRDVYYIVKRAYNVNLKYVLAILNSKLYYLWYYYRGKRKGDTLELYAKPLKETPIKIPSQNIQNRFSSIVDEIIKLKDDGLDTSNLENSIDLMIYKLYGLNIEEIMLVDDEFCMSEDEYKNFASDLFP